MMAMCPLSSKGKGEMQMMAKGERAEIAGSLWDAVSKWAISGTKLGNVTKSNLMFISISGTRMAYREIDRTRWPEGKSGVANKMKMKAKMKTDAEAVKN